MFFTILQVFIVLFDNAMVVVGNETRVDNDAQGPMQICIDRNNNEPLPKYVDVFIFGP